MPSYLCWQIVSSTSIFLLIATDAPAFKKYEENIFYYPTFTFMSPGLSILFS